MRLNTLLQVSLIALAVVVLVATPAEANAVAGAVILFAPGFVIWVLAIIIGIETIAFSISMGISAWSALWVASVANVISTLLGIPLTWGVMSFLMSRARKTEEKQKPWMAPAKGLLFVMLFFTASWVIESAIAMPMLSYLAPQVVDDGILIGNLLTYGIVAGFFFGSMVSELLKDWSQTFGQSPVDSIQSASRAPVRAEAMMGEIPAYEGYGQYQLIEAEFPAAETGIGVQRASEGSGNGNIRVTMAEGLSLVEDRGEGGGVDDP
jgi:hypothetical protein